jgi:uncharacterized membrane protein
MSYHASAPKLDSSQPGRNKIWDDHRIEVIVGHLLRIGVIVSGTIVLWGACVYLFRHAHEPADYRIFRGEPSDFRTIPGIIDSVLNGRGRGWIQLGLLFLIATPIARVVFCVVGFALERDRLYIVFTAIVLAVLLYSLLGSGLAW